LRGAGISGDALQFHIRKFDLPLLRKFIEENPIDRVGDNTREIIERDA
jgi:hypothetical protein